MKMTIGMINKIHNLSIKIFEAEEDDVVDRRKVTNRERAIMRILDKVCYSGDIKIQIYGIISSNIFQENNDSTIKELKKIGVEIK
ncbi:MAG: hypothetical protein R3Y05_01540 [bacterium]